MRSNEFAHTDTKQQVVAARLLLSAGGLKRFVGIAQGNAAAMKMVAAYAHSTGLIALFL